MNTWPKGFRHALSQSDHEKWNAQNYPGTRQLCGMCDEPTGRCEEDSMFADSDEDCQCPLCETCYLESVALATPSEERKP